jgi:hypothetical protein
VDKMSKGELRLAIGDQELQLNLAGLQKTIQKSIIENAVKEFFNDLEEQEKKKENKIMAKWEKGFVETYKEETAPTVEKPEIPRDTPTKTYAGIKETPEGTLYQLFYICPNCRNKGKHFVDKSCIETFCHDCGYNMKPRAATNKGFGYQDDFSNYFIAGKFKRADEISWENYADKEEEESLVS